MEKHKDTSINDILADVYRYSKYFVQLAFAQEPDLEIKQALADINSLKVDVAYPFLLTVYDDYHQGVLPKSEFIRILRLVESYVFRRAICGIPTSSMNKTFAVLIREIDQENYLESVEIALVCLSSYKRFPDNEEFRREFVVKDIYNLRNCNYVLRKLENYERSKELVDVENYTIEHIIPQNPNLSKAWQLELGDSWKEVQAKYLHTIGNLTLTGYNSELSVRSFLEKRNMKNGFADSPLRLNRMLAKLEHWYEAEIKHRAEVLAEQAIKIWAFPSIQLASHKLNIHRTNSSYEVYLQRDILEVFEAINKFILNLDISVQLEKKNIYIAYKIKTNFVDIRPQKSRLVLWLNIKYDEINDPKGLCRDVTNIGHYGNGDVEISCSSLAEIDYVIFLVRQAFNKHSKNLTA